MAVSCATRALCPEKSLSSLTKLCETSSELIISWTSRCDRLIRSLKETNIYAMSVVTALEIKCSDRPTGGLVSATSHCLFLGGNFKFVVVLGEGKGGEGRISSRQRGGGGLGWFY